jgi:septal ring factor EnvC (AmiA/AmiB activator)
VPIDEESHSASRGGPGLSHFGTSLRDKAAIVLSGLILIMLVAGTAVALGPGRGIRADIDRQRENTDEMLAALHRQIGLIEAQLAQIELTRAATDRAAETAERTLAIVESQLGLLERQVGTSEEVLRLQRRLVELAEQTLREVREINRKTVGPPGPTTTTLPR